MRTMRAPAFRRKSAQSLRGVTVPSQGLRTLYTLPGPTVGPWFATRIAMRSAAKILIVDDETNARSALSELLRDEGYEVASAVDGGAAQARIADFHPDLVLTDVHMPGVGGLDLLATTRRMAAGPAVVLMSARPEPDGAGVPFVGKPIDIDELLAKVQSALHRR